VCDNSKFNVHSGSSLISQCLTRSRSSSPIVSVWQQSSTGKRRIFWDKSMPLDSIPLRAAECKRKRRRAFNPFAHLIHTFHACAHDCLTKVQ
jgi:hypothetical protein